MSGQRQEIAWIGSVSAQAWLDRHKTEDAQDLVCAATQALRTLASQPLSPDAHLGTLETLRVALIGAARETIATASFRPLPLTDYEVSQATIVLQFFHALRDAYAAILGGASADVLAIPEVKAARDLWGVSATRDQLAAFALQTKPIAPKLLVAQRMMSAQASYIESCMRMRLSVTQGEWDTLMRYAHQMGRENLMEPGLIDPCVPECRVNTRMSFVSVILLLLARPESFTPLEFELACDLCRRFAVTVKFRVDEGDLALQTSPWPSFAVTAFYTARLDTRTLTAELKRLQSELQSGADSESLGIDRRLSSASARRAVENLLAAWRTPIQSLTTWRRPLGEMSRVIAGMRAISGSLSPSDQSFDITATLGRNVYEYRRYDENRVNDVLSLDTSQQRLKQLVEAGQGWRIEGENAVGFLFTRQAETPRLQLDQLTLISTGNGFEQVALFLGYVDSLRQKLTTEEQVPMQEIGVHLLRGVPSLVMIKLQDTRTYEEGFILRTPPMGSTLTALDLRDLDFDQSSLVLPLARHTEGTITEMVLDGAMQRVRIGRLLFRGLDFDQVSFTLL